MVPRRRKRIEGLPYRPDGRAEVTLNQMCLLLALRDARGHRVKNRRLWTEWAMPRLEQVRPNPSYRNLYLTAWAMPKSLVVQWGQGIGMAAKATPLGLKLPSRHGEIWIPGHGLWEGFDHLIGPHPTQGRGSWLERMEAAARASAYVRGDMWGGPRDGISIALTIPPCDAVYLPWKSPDGRELRVKYVKLSLSEGEPVTLEPTSGSGAPRPDARGLLALLEGKRGVRYRWCESVPA